MRNYIPWEKAESIAPDRVKVYRNLTYKCWTICDAKDGKLYCHADRVETFVNYHNGTPLYEAERVVCKKAADGSMNIYYA